jgi:hypothetical protein
MEHPMNTKIILRAALLAVVAFGAACGPKAGSGVHKCTDPKKCGGDVPPPPCLPGEPCFKGPKCDDP